MANPFRRFCNRPWGWRCRYPTSLPIEDRVADSMAVAWETSFPGRGHGNPPSGRRADEAFASVSARPIGLSVRVRAVTRFDRIDEAALAILVDRFYGRVRRDALLGPVFNRVIGTSDEAWEPHLARIRDFWSSVMLATGRYGGRPMSLHAALPDIGDRHFQRWLELFGAACAELFEPGPAGMLEEKAARMAQALRAGIALARGEEHLIPSPAEVTSSGLGIGGDGRRAAPAA